MAPSPEKSALRAHPKQKIFFVFAKHRLFSMLFSAPTLDLWALTPAFATPQQEIMKMAKKNAAPTKSEILATISKDTELTKKQVGAVFDSLSAVIKKSLRSHGIFTH
ncbi:MAG: HU family DNA-binding protein, partial [Steroidobacterales bacterium]